MATNNTLKNQIANKQQAPAEKQDFALKSLMKQDTIRQKFDDVLGKKAPQFIASMINMVGNDNYLKSCDALSVIGSCLVAATLDLPVDKNLGYAWVVPYKGKASFQMGYRGYVQLALRSGQYKAINVIDVHEGELIKWNPLSEELVIDFDSKTSDIIIGYAGYFELLNGFKKQVYWSRDRIEEHRKKFSKSTFGWDNDYDAMARKTVLRNLLNHWGILSIEMQTAMGVDLSATETGYEINNTVIANDSEVIDIDFDWSTIESEEKQNE